MDVGREAEEVEGGGHGHGHGHGQTRRDGVRRVAGG